MNPPSTHLTALSEAKSTTARRSLYFPGTGATAAAPALAAGFAHPARCASANTQASVMPGTLRWSSVWNDSHRLRWSVLSNLLDCCAQAHHMA